MGNSLDGPSCSMFKQFLQAISRCNVSECFPDKCLQHFTHARAKRSMLKACDERPSGSKTSGRREVGESEHRSTLERGGRHHLSRWHPSSYGSRRRKIRGEVKELMKRK